MAKKLVTTMVVIIAVAVVIGVFFMIYNSSSKKVDTDTVKDIIDSSSTGCQIAPSVNQLTKDDQVLGTTPTITTNSTIYDGSYVGNIPSSLSKGKSLDVMATATNYLNTESKIEKLDCGSNDMVFTFTPYAAPSYIIRDANYNTLTDSSTAGVTNESISANQVIDTVKISGTPLKSTGDMLLIVDYANKTEVTTAGITVSGKGAERLDSAPTWFTPAGTGSAVVAYKVPAIVNGGTEEYDVTLSPEAGRSVGEGLTVVYTTLYTLNPIVLDSYTGKFITDKTWQDSRGTDKTIANVDYDYTFS